MTYSVVVPALMNLSALEEMTPRGWRPLRAVAPRYKVVVDSPLRSLMTSKEVGGVRVGHGWRVREKEIRKNGSVKVQCYKK